jgi:hypothetical protein
MQHITCLESGINPPPGGVSQQSLCNSFVPDSFCKRSGRLCASTCPTLFRKLADLPPIHGYLVGNRSDVLHRCALQYFSGNKYCTVCRHTSSSAADTFGSLVATSTAHLGRGPRHRPVERGKTLSLAQKKAIPSVQADLRNEDLSILSA